MNHQPVVRIDGLDILGRGLHAVFAEAFGFPSFYGRNMDAWVDCMSSLDRPDDGLTSVHAPPGSVLVLEIHHFKDLKRQELAVADAIVECAAFVNWSRLRVGEPAVLCVSFHE